VFQRNSYLCLQGSPSLSLLSLLLSLAVDSQTAYSILKMEAAGSSNTLVTIYRVSQEECAILQKSVPYVKLYRYNPKHLYPKLKG
jgi:hypothetical protein